MALVDAFCMVPVVTRPLAWQSGHYELVLDQTVQTITLRFRSSRLQAFRLTLVRLPNGQLAATVSGRLRAGGWRDLVTADAQLDGELMRAACPQLPGPPSPVPPQLQDVLAVKRRRA